MRSATATSRVTSGCRILGLFLRMIVGGHVTDDNSLRPLTAHEFEAMMRELDDAQDWMLDQLEQRRIAQERPDVSVDTDQ